MSECHDHHHHDHHHGHSHSHDAASREETIALLSYMAEHNHHHAQELHDVAHSVSGEAAELIHNAMEDYGRGTEKLLRALDVMKAE